MLRILKLLLLLLLCYKSYGQKLYSTNEGRITFHSNAQNESIKAISKELSGVINVQKKTFAFKVDIKTFDGFNSPLQKDHFGENYLEADLYPTASFTGKIIEDVVLSANGEYKVRAKGKLTIHGVEQERIIYTSIVIKENTIQAESNFDVHLSDHNIKVPRIVFDKLANEINISVLATFKLES